MVLGGWRGHDWRQRSCSTNCEISQIKTPHPKSPRRTPRRPERGPRGPEAPRGSTDFGADVPSSLRGAGLVCCGVFPMKEIMGVIALWKSPSSMNWKSWITSALGHWSDNIYVKIHSINSLGIHVFMYIQYTRCRERILTNEIEEDFFIVQNLSG